MFCGPLALVVDSRQPSLRFDSPVGHRTQPGGARQLTEHVDRGPGLTPRLGESMKF